MVMTTKGSTQRRYSLEQNERRAVWDYKNSYLCFYLLDLITH
jgi:hypothetical protein